MLILIENGEVFAPEPRGRQSVLLFGDKIARIGEVDARVAASVLGLELEVIDATLSSDADSSAPRQLYQVVQQAILEYRLTLEQVLPLVTANTATVLKLAGKGRLEPGLDADVLVVRRDSLEIVEVIARGHRMVKAGKFAITEKVAETSSRELHLVGEK
jgi:predicted amidohydrolase